MQHAFAALESVNPMTQDVSEQYFIPIDTMHTTNSQFHLIVPKGANEMRSLAIRFQRALPHIFEKKFDRRKFVFRFTDTERILESYRHFANGQFGENANQSMTIEPRKKGSILLNTFMLCESWQKSVNSSCTERVKFEKSPIFTQLVHDVSTRLGFKRRLNLQQLLDMYDICRYEFAWESKNSSAWCAVSLSHSTYAMHCIVRHIRSQAFTPT